MTEAPFVQVRSSVLDDLLAEARREPGVECCGLLAGRYGVIDAFLPARNRLASASEYEIDPVELFALFRRMRAEGLTHLGIYHSHPRGSNVPSLRDVEQAFYPDSAYFIVSPLAGSDRPVRAFRIADGRISELTIRAV